MLHRGTVIAESSSPNNDNTIVKGTVVEPTNGGAAEDGLGAPLPRLGKWTSGICDCCDLNSFPITAQTFAIPCIVNAYMMNYFDTGSPSFDFGRFCGLFCLDCCTYGACTPIMTFGLRRQVIERYKVHDETMCWSLCLHQCCPSCSSCQVQRELLARRECCGGGFQSIPPQQQRMSSRGLPPTERDASALAPPHTPLRAEFNSSLCGCGCLEFIDMVCCYDCNSSCTSTRLEEGRIHSRRDDDDFRRRARALRQNTEATENDTCANFDCFACLGAHFCRGFVSMGHRRAAMERYNLFNETVMESLCISTLCASCSEMQVRREMGFRGEWPGSLMISAPVFEDEMTRRRVATTTTTHQRRQSSGAQGFRRLAEQADDSSEDE